VSNHCSTTFGSWASVNEHLLQHKFHIQMLCAITISLT